MKSISIEIKWGILFIVVQLLWMMAEKMFGFLDEQIQFHEVISYFFIMPAFAIYYLGLREKREKFYSGKITYKQSFIAGLWITLIAFMLTPISLLVTFYAIAPNFFQNMIAYTVETSRMTLSEAIDFFNFPSYLIQSLIFSIGAGVLTAAILSVFIKKA